ncbi:MAG: hypothetical protein KF800_00975 [Lysobacter sp.]|nr:hypothetical protein [Lysobacter sp.]
MRAIDLVDIDQSCCAATYASSLMAHGFADLAFAVIDAISRSLMSIRQ